MRHPPNDAMACASDVIDCACSHVTSCLRFRLLSCMSNTYSKYRKEVTSLTPNSCYIALCLMWINKKILLYTGIHVVGGWFTACYNSPVTRKKEIIMTNIIITNKAIRMVAWKCGGLPCDGLLLTLISHLLTHACHPSERRNNGRRKHHQDGEQNMLSMLDWFSSWPSTNTHGTPPVLIIVNREAFLIWTGARHKDKARQRG